MPMRTTKQTHYYKLVYYGPMRGKLTSMASVHTAYQQTGMSIVEAIVSTTERMAFWEGPLCMQLKRPAYRPGKNTRE
jgi:hypothetical protein